MGVCASSRGEEAGAALCQRAGSNSPITGHTCTHQPEWCSGKACLRNGSKGCTEGGRAGNKKSENKQRQHQGQDEDEEENKDEVPHGGADSHTAACGEGCGRVGGYFLKET